MSVESSVSVEEIRSLISGEYEEDYEIFSTADIAVIRRLAIENNNNVKEIIRVTGDIIYEEIMNDEDIEGDDEELNFHEHNKYLNVDLFNNVKKKIQKTIVMDFFEKLLNVVIKNIPDHTDAEIVAILDAEFAWLLDDIDEESIECLMKNFEAVTANPIDFGRDEIVFLIKIAKENDSFEKYMQVSGELVHQEIKNSVLYVALMKDVDEFIDHYRGLFGPEVKSAFEDGILTIALGYFEYVFNGYTAMIAGKNDQEIEELIDLLVSETENLETTNEPIEEQKPQAASPRMRM